VLLENKFFKCSICEVLTIISIKQYITIEHKSSQKELIDNQAQYTISSTQREMYVNPLQKSPLDNGFNKIFQSSIIKVINQTTTNQELVN
jgi:hypothetical protein